MHCLPHNNHFWGVVEGSQFGEGAPPSPGKNDAPRYNISALKKAKIQLLSESSPRRLHFQLTAMKFDLVALKFDIRLECLICVLVRYIRSLCTDSRRDDKSIVITTYSS